tara:strand:+ start:755 stop:1636 length:882 start_codon:yes stop_codon:yes gene_type:complete
MNKIFENQKPTIVSNNLNTDFNFENIIKKLSKIKMPELSTRRCIIGTQLNEIMDSNIDKWNPKECNFNELIDTIRNGNNYASIRSESEQINYNGIDLIYESKLDSIILEKLIEEIKPYIPKEIMPINKKFEIIFWIGSLSKNFGLHTDFMCNQLIVMYQGIKEIQLILPENASELKPYLINNKPYKSSLRTLKNYKIHNTSNYYKFILYPGDILYIPPFWWHEVKTISKDLSLSVTYRYNNELKYEFKSILNSIDNLDEHKIDDFYKKLCKENSFLEKHIKSYIKYQQLNYIK